VATLARAMRSCFAFKMCFLEEPLPNRAAVAHERNAERMDADDEGIVVVEECAVVSTKTLPSRASSTNTEPTATATATATAQVEKLDHRDDAVYMDLVDSSSSSSHAGSDDIAPMAQSSPISVAW